jgi:diguanylate cyclase (GGDEF)-like protein
MPTSRPPVRLDRSGAGHGSRAAALVAAIVTVVWCSGFIIWQLITESGTSQADHIGDLAPLVPTGLAVALALRAACVAHDRRTAGAWLLMAIAFACDFAATSYWAWLELVRHVAPFPSLADVGYAGFYVFVMAGLLCFPGPRRNAGERLRVVLDIAVVFLAGAMGVWYFALGPTSRGIEFVGLETVLSLAYPVGDLVLVFGVTTLLVRGTVASSHAVLRLLMVGCLAFVLGDLGFADLSLTDSYDTGDWPDAFWMLAWTAIVVAVAVECRRSSRPSAGPGLDPDLAARVAVPPYIAIMAAFGLTFSVAWGTVRFPLDGMLLGVGAITFAVVLRQVSAIRENARLNAKLHALATTDPLTELINRRQFLEIAARHIQLGHGDELCLIVADIDHFKSINDSYGHGVGDEALVWVARHFVERLPREAVVARIGGDEFVALLPARSLADAVAVAEDLVASVVATAQPLPGGPDHLSLSLGVASAHGCPDVAALLRAADDGLYVAKRNGRGRVGVHQDRLGAEVLPGIGGVDAFPRPEPAEPEGLDPWTVDATIAVGI